MPEERSGAFLPAFIRMSVAIQSALRERVPVKYFEDLKKFGDLKTAFPMLVYQASPPFRGKKRTELSYDVLNPALIAILFRRAKPKLTERLAQVENRLRAAGLPDLADQYAPKRTAEILSDVQRLSKSRRYLCLLIRGESVLVDALVPLSGLGSLPRKAQAKRWASLGKKWNYQLRRLYPGTDFTWLAQPLLTAAVETLQPDSGPLNCGGPGVTGIGTGVVQTGKSEFPEVG